MCQPRPQPPVPSARAHAAWAAAVVAFAALALVGLDAFGRSRRSPPEPTGRSPVVLVAERPADAIAAWRSRRLRGRVLVHFGAFLHFVPDEGTALLARALRGAGSGPATDAALAARATHLDYLWTAAALGLVRHVHYVSPPAALRRRAAALPGGGVALPARIDLDALARTIDLAPPRSREPVVVDVSPSWFEERTGDDLLAMLNASGLRADLVCVHLAQGSEDVSDPARRAAREFAARLAAGGGR